jgi:hypothetical protein
LQYKISAGVTGRRLAWSTGIRNLCEATRIIQMNRLIRDITSLPPAIAAAARHLAADLITGTSLKKQKSRTITRPALA